MLEVTLHLLCIATWIQYTTWFLNSCLHSLILSLYFCVAPTTGLVSCASSSTTAAKEQALRAGSTCTSKSNELLGLARTSCGRLLDSRSFQTWLVYNSVCPLTFSFFGTFCACLTAAHFRTSKSVLFVCDDWRWNLQDSTWTFEKVWHPRGIPAKQWPEHLKEFAWRSILIYQNTILQDSKVSTWRDVHRMGWRAQHEVVSWQRMHRPQGTAGLILKFPIASFYSPDLSHCFWITVAVDTAWYQLLSDQQAMPCKLSQFHIPVIAWRGLSSCFSQVIAHLRYNTVSKCWLLKFALQVSC